MSSLTMNLVMWAWMLITLQFFDETEQTGTSMVFVKQRNRILQYPEQLLAISKMECAQKCVSDAACVAFAYQGGKCTTSYTTTTARNTESDAYILDRSGSSCKGLQRAGVEDALHLQYSKTKDECKSGTMIMQKLTAEEYKGFRNPQTPVVNPQPDCLQFCLQNASCVGVEMHNADCYMASPDYAYTVGIMTVSPIFLKMDACSEIPVNYSVNTNNAKELLLTYYNEKRSLVARGKFKAKNGTLKTASAMHKMAWNYTLESSAQLEAAKCLKQIRELPGENAQYDNMTDIRKDRARTMAMAWIGEIETKGWPGNKYSRQFTAFVKNAMQVLWAETRQIGCGVEQCHGKTMQKHLSMVCHYWPAGKIEAQPVYAEGKTASVCPSGTKKIVSGNYTGLCETVYL